jgi:hypothetical protein
MRITISRDGLKRFTIKTELRIDAEAAATFLTVSDLDVQNKTPMEFAGQMVSKPKRELLDEIRKMAQRYGDEIPFYRVGDDGLSEHRDALARGLRSLWGID